MTARCAPATSPRPLPLTRALGLVVLYGEHSDRRFDRRARWLSRIGLEQPTVEPGRDTQRPLRARGIRIDPQSSRHALAALATDHGLIQARARLLDG